MRIRVTPFRWALGAYDNSLIQIQIGGSAGMSVWGQYGVQRNEENARLRRTYQRPQ
jgi:hypothetical protein